MGPGGVRGETSPESERDYLIVGAGGMNKKLLTAIRNNPKDVRFEDACKVAESLGFVHKGGKGSHRAFSRSGEPIGLNFQDRDGKIPTYQARQLIAMMDKYGKE
jgi:hypothetical protein